MRHRFYVFHEKKSFFTIEENASGFPIIVPMGPPRWDAEHLSSKSLLLNPCWKLGFAWEACLNLWRTSILPLERLALSRLWQNGWNYQWLESMPWIFLVLVINRWEFLSFCHNLGYACLFNGEIEIFLKFKHSSHEKPSF